MADKIVTANQDMEASAAEGLVEFLLPLLEMAKTNTVLTDEEQKRMLAQIMLGLTRFGIKSWQRSSSPWAPRGIGIIHKYVKQIKRAPGWPNIQHPQFEYFLSLFNAKGLHNISGRRLIGKTHIFSNIALALANKHHVVYITAKEDEWEFAHKVESALKEFDSRIAVHLNARDAVDALWWLMHSGVYVIIDEFQRLGKTQGGRFEQLQDLIDTEGDYNGVLITLGSHIALLDETLRSGKAALFGRGFMEHQMTPLDFYDISTKLLYKLPPLTQISMMACFNGLIGLYYVCYQQHGFKEDTTFNELQHIVKGLFKKDTFYGDQLRSESSQVLRAISECKGKTLATTLNYIINATKLAKVAVRSRVDDLISYGFVQQQDPLFQENLVPLGPKQHSRYQIIDCPLRTSLKKSETDFTNMQGLIWEEYCKAAFHHTEVCKKLLNLDKVLVYDGYWAEQCTEIDVVLLSEETKSVFWGSCKRNYKKQERGRLASHVTSFFNNRGYKKHPWQAYRHIFLFLSPEFDEDYRKRLLDIGTVNNLLQDGINSGISTMVMKLSNVHGNGAQFKWAPDVPSPIFVIDLSMVISLQDFTAA